MVMWVIIMWSALILTAMALVYVSNRVCQFGCIKCITHDSEKRKAAIGGGIVFGLFLIVGYFINFMNAIVCVIYFAMSWIICDLLFCLWQKLTKRVSNRYYAGALAILLAFAGLAYGWYADHHVWRTEYHLTTDKNINSLKIVMFADSHFGTTFKADGFAKHMERIKQENPNAVILVGDFVDDDTTKEDMIAAAEILGQIKTKYGVYFVFGNHDSGYYGPEYRGFSSAELVAELEKNGVKVLRDETILLDDNFYIVGRKDYSVEKEARGTRLSMSELVENLAKDKYIIVADHQPADYKKQAQSEVDLVISGHTHGGQLFPFNNVGKWIGANDMIYGHEKRRKTDFIVTSGISDWAIKFKTGTKSEYVVINIAKNR